MKRQNPLKHIVKTIREHESYNHETVLAGLKMTDEQFKTKAARPNWQFVQNFAKLTGTTVDVKATFGRPSSDSRSVEFRF